MSSRTLYVTDLDFTLLMADARASAATVQGINELSERGTLITFATARSFGSASRATAGIRWRHPVVTYGGTIIADGTSGRPFDVALLDDAVVRAICAATASDPELEPVFHTYESGAERIRWRVGSESAGVRLFIDHRLGDPRLRPLASWRELERDSAYYAVVIGREDPVRALAAALTEATRDCAVFVSTDPYTPDQWWLEIHSGAATKADGARRVAERLDAERIVAFGDNHNDVPLFEFADEAYAVGNAVPELKERATGVLEGHDTDAVVRWLLANA
ncbi:HAD family hydrolase [Microbacterium capsulatum]|uniref:HAD family hydrolase n=1 Tax=Microbacterium capsulatum TaxID=3041921 RepID=A0ABU0XKM9_9MICO|nr:HAD family hydrolase [Microbacterium sp. ASV81]MDQ4215179.1 HAD family hydrolase [Microbacterium sp. ASV81]